MMNLDRPVELPCQEVVELVTDYVEEDLLPATKEMVDNHLSGCPGCTAYFEQSGTPSLYYALWLKSQCFPRAGRNCCRNFANGENHSKGFTRANSLQIARWIHSQTLVRAAT